MNHTIDKPESDSSQRITALFQSGQFADAEQLTLKLLEQEPQSGFLWKALGTVQHILDKDAVVALQRACMLLPEDAEARANLGNALRDASRLQEARSQYQLGLVLAPQVPEMLLNLGNVLLALGQVLQARASLVRALCAHPGYVQARYNLGLVFTELGQIEEAIITYRSVLTADPQFAEAHNNLALLLASQRRTTDVKRHLLAAVAAQPDFTAAWDNLGKFYHDEQDFDAALACYEKALVQQPAHADTLNNLGNLLKDGGKLDVAARAYQAAITVDPDFIGAHYNLAQIKKYSANDPDRMMLECRIDTIESMPIKTRIPFWFTLGKMYEDINLVDKAFAAYQKGNSLKWSCMHWSEQAEIDLFARAKKVFSRDYFTKHLPAALVDETPIFIVGMPRSGTTLLEQILASYPGIFGAGELPAISDVITRAMPDNSYQHYPESIPHFSQEQLTAMGEDYLREVRQISPQSSRIVDKMPANFFYVGLIHQILPSAKIIHMMRDPMDTCLSCFAHQFENENLPFSYDLHSLGRYFQRYAELMQYWRDVLPAGSFLDIRYEDMVDDTEAEARRLIEYLGLPWNPQCLDFHRNPRRVKTASLAQVRQPIFRSSLQRWKKFERHLAPLYELISQIPRG